MDKLTSRKLWIAVLSALLFIAQEQYGEAMGVVLAYLGVQGYLDSK